MNKYLEYYQFHETDENGNVICLYCIVKRTDDGIYLQFEKEYNTALEELKEFAYDNQIYTTEELKNSSKLHLQVPNKKFREELAKKYGYKTDEINNFNEKFGISLIVPLGDNKINYEEVINPNPISEDTNSNSNPVSEDTNSNSNPVSEDTNSNSNEDDDENTDWDEMRDFDTEKRHPIIQKLKSLRLKGIKKLAIRIGAIATIAVLGITGIKACSKKGVSEDLVTVEPVTNNDNLIEDVDQDPTTEENNISNSASVTDLSTFQTYLNQSSETTKKYMTNFKKNLKSFNKVAKKYSDITENSRLGLDTDNYTAFKMALLGSKFGQVAKNVSTYWDNDELYKNYVKANDQLKQLATVQTDSTGFAKIFSSKERQEFYQKYENMIIDLNNTENIDDKINKTENILSQVKTDFNMESQEYNPEQLLRGDSKYVAVVPMIRSVYDRAKDCGYDNLPSDDKMKQLSQSYKKVVKDNLYNALMSIDVKEDITPSYEMYTSEIAIELENDDLYVIDDERNIRNTELYQRMKKLPVKIKEEVTPLPTDIIEETNNDELSTNINDYGVSDAINDLVTTSDDNFEYKEDTPSTNTTSQTVNETPTPEDSNSSQISDETSIADQIIESDEGNDLNSDDTNQNQDTTDDSKDDSQVVESEEDIANSMNDVINDGGYAETPDGWQIDDDYKKDGTDTIDGSVSDITIEGDSSTIDDSQSDNVGIEEVPTVSDDTTSQNDGIIESEEDYNSPENNISEDTTSEESVTTEEVPVYDDSDYSTDNQTDYSIVDEQQSDIATYQIEEEESDLIIPAEQTVAKLTQEQAIDQVINYNTNGVNAVPVFNASDNSWTVEVINDNVKEAKSAKYII